MPCSPISRTTDSARRTAFALAALALAAAATGAPVLEIQRTSTPPRIDGRLDDPVWREAAHTDTFRQFTPLENAAPSERTECWVAYDSDQLYVAVRCHDSAGLAGLRAFSMQRDQDNGSDDIVRVVIDTFRRANDGYYFALTAGGGKHDGLIQDKTQGNGQWDGIWFGKVTRDPGGWSAEFAIPVKSLAFDPSGESWGFNLSRTIRRKQEIVRWSCWLRTRSTFSLPDLGTLQGLSGLRQGHGLDFKPYASLNRESQSSHTTLTARPGFDLIWHATPSLAATVTVNTDFADAEVDQRQVNLGRFPLFYPEKRTFFTQDAPLFSFGGIDWDGVPFFSRRIGLAEDGSRVDLRGGLKLTGRAGPWTLGLLDVQTSPHAGIESKNLLVGRAALQVLAESNAGIIFTHGDPRGPGSNSLVGADFNYNTTRLPGHRTLNAHAAVQMTDSTRAGGRGTSTLVSCYFPNDPVEVYAFYRHIDRAYDPALGFAARTGIFEAYQQAGYIWHPATRWLDRVRVDAQFDWVTDLGGRVLAIDHDLPSVTFVTPSADQLHFQFTRTSDRLDDPFEIRPGTIIPVGNYTWNRFQADLFTTRSRPVSTAITVRHLGFYTGHRRDYSAVLEWRASPHCSTSLSGELRRVRLPQGNFDVRVATVRAVYTFTPDLQLSLLAQYDNLSGSLGANLRLRWTLQPGNDLFLIVNQGYDTTADHFRPVQNTIALKTAWTLRF